jgi:hypothetical protein
MSSAFDLYLHLGRQRVHERAVRALHHHAVRRLLYHLTDIPRQVLALLSG